MLYAFAACAQRDADDGEPHIQIPHCLRSRLAKWPPEAGTRDRRPSGSQVGVSGTGVTAGICASLAA